MSHATFNQSLRLYANANTHPHVDPESRGKLFHEIPHYQPRTYLPIGEVGSVCHFLAWFVPFWGSSRHSPGHFLLCTYSLWFDGWANFEARTRSSKRHLLLRRSLFSKSPNRLRLIELVSSFEATIADFPYAYISPKVQFAAHHHHRGSLILYATSVRMGNFRRRSYAKAKSWSRMNWLHGNWIYNSICARAVALVNGAHCGWADEKMPIPGDGFVVRLLKGTIHHPSSSTSLGMQFCAVNRWMAARLHS